MTFHFCVAYLSFEAMIFNDTEVFDSDMIDSKKYNYIYINDLWNILSVKKVV